MVGSDAKCRHDKNAGRPGRFRSRSPMRLPMKDTLISALLRRIDDEGAING
jgi:hypothetical protein